MTEDEYLPLVRKIAGFVKAKCQQADFDDLVGAGCLGLVIAVSKYDPSRGASMGTYLGNRVRGAMLDHLRKTDPLSRHERTKVKKGIPTFRLGREPSYEVAHVEEKEARSVPATTERQDHLVESRERQALAYELIRRLRVRERRVALEYYWHDRSDNDIGKEQGVTEGRICQIRHRALERMRMAA